MVLLVVAWRHSSSETTNCAVKIVPAGALEFNLHPRSSGRLSSLSGHA